VAGRRNTSQDAQDAWDAENTSLASGRNADGSDAGSVFADEATGFGSGLSKSVYQSISAIACSNIVPAAPVTVFRRESVVGLGRPGHGIPGSPTGLEDLTSDVVPLWVASGDEYPTLDDRKVGEL